MLARVSSIFSLPGQEFLIALLLEQGAIPTAPLLPTIQRDGESLVLRGKKTRSRTVLATPRCLKLHSRKGDRNFIQKCCWKCCFWSLCSCICSLTVSLPNTAVVRLFSSTCSSFVSNQSRPNPTRAAWLVASQIGCHTTRRLHTTGPHISERMSCHVDGSPSPIDQVVPS